MADTSVIRQGEDHPLGASWDGTGTNFALFSSVASKVELCLFDDEGREHAVALPERDGFTWHGYLPGVGPGQRYGYRVHGPYDPVAGQRCDPSKLLLDPYAKAIDGPVDWHPAVFSYQHDNPDERNTDDSAPYVPRSIVTSPYFDWGADRAPRIPASDSVIYEAHVRGLTKLHPQVPADERGSYLGLAHPAVIEHLLRIGVTAIELLPVHQFVADNALSDRGLTNYWGYNTIGFFAPHHGYASAGTRGQQVAEFKSMVRALHAAGLEVILDVVYNHTGEGNHLGPTLSLRGIDNGAYYRLVPDDPQYYADTTGTGNSLRMRHPQVLALIMDSLRYWVTEMHVDGFRFDLASTLVRTVDEVDHKSAFLSVVQQDPVLAQVKLIAEPWDAADGGYQVGKFPAPWAEWNDKYRDCVRDFWRGAPVLREFATRLTGSADLYQRSGRRPAASVNFVTCHDGFTLTDLVSYDHKHNEANGQDNSDGNDDNRSSGWGAEGPADDPRITALRDRQRRNFVATIALSQGLPMLLGGDEMGRTQHGNNNAYCQDNEISWLHWPPADPAMADFTARLLRLRRDHPVFRRRSFFAGHAPGGQDGERPDIAWYSPAGEEMTQDEWEDGASSALAIFLNGDSTGEAGTPGRPVTDDSFLMLFNAGDADLGFVLPQADVGEPWVKVVDTADPAGPDGSLSEPAALKPGDRADVASHSMQVLRRVR